MVTDKDWQKYLNKILVFVTYASRSEQETRLRLRRYLKSADFTEVDKSHLENTLIEYLGTLGLLDDKKFLKDFIDASRGSRKALNKKTIQAKLVKKGLTTDEITNALENLTNEEMLESAKLLLQKKYKTYIKENNDDISLRQTMCSFLLTKGFDWEICRLAVDSWPKLK